jgi:predicted phosphoribosyltransferase
LADELHQYKNSKNTVVVGIPRGGVPVASEVAKRLNLPLDVVVARKVGAPRQQELAIGAVAPNGVFIFDNDLVSRLQIGDDYKKSAMERERKEVGVRVTKFRGSKKVNFKDKTVILVDDGIATGATTKAAIKYLRSKKAKKIVLAVPVSPKESAQEFKALVDEFYAIDTPQDFYAVGEFYQEFPQVSSKEVIKLLQND